MDQITKVNLKIMPSTGTEFTFGRITENTLGNGKTIKCMAKEFLHGLMEEYMMEITKMERNRVLEHMSGRKKKSIRVIGRMAGSMEKEQW